MLSAKWETQRLYNHKSKIEHVRVKNKCIYEDLTAYITICRRHANFDGTLYQVNFAESFNPPCISKEHKKITQPHVDKFYGFLRQNIWKLFRLTSHRETLSIVDSFHILPNKQLIGTLASTFLITTKFTEYQAIADNGLMVDNRRRKSKWVYKQPNGIIKIKPQVIASWPSIRAKHISEYTHDTIHNLCQKIRHALAQDFVLWHFFYRYYNIQVNDGKFGFINSLNSDEINNEWGNAKSMANLLLKPSPLSIRSLFESAYSYTVNDAKRNHNIIDKMIDQRSSPRYKQNLTLFTAEVEHIKKTKASNILAINRSILKNKDLNMDLYNPFINSKHVQIRQHRYAPLANLPMDCTDAPPTSDYDYIILNNPYDFLDDVDQLMQMLSLYNHKEIMVRLTNADQPILNWWVNALKKYYKKWRIIKLKNMSTFCFYEPNNAI